jgi:hypothetical protein
MIDIDDGAQSFSSGRTCPCGGQISRGVLKGSRERWSCLACGRYEVISNESNFRVVLHAQRKLPVVSG